MSAEAQLMAAAVRLEEDLGPGGDAVSVDMDLYGWTYTTEMGMNGVERHDQPMQGSTYCNEGVVRWVYEGKSFEFRAQRDDWCFAVTEGLGLPEDWGLVRTETHGAATEFIIDALGEDPGRFTYRLSDNGRIDQIIMDGESYARFTVAYGERRAIEIPPATDRYPESIHEETAFSPGEHRTVFSYNGSGVAIEEFEVSVQSAEAHVRFGLANGTQYADSFEFIPSENGDGILGAGDEFIVRRADWLEQDQYDVLVIDVWAGRPINFEIMCPDGVCR